MMYASLFLKKVVKMAKEVCAYDILLKREARAELAPYKIEFILKEK